MSLDCLPGVQRAQPSRFGTQMLVEGVRFRLWAPNIPSVSLKILDLEFEHPMTQCRGGWHEIEVPHALAGMHYVFVLPDGQTVPDPASRFQPYDVHGPSEIIDPRSYRWTDLGWRGRPWEEMIIYELHIGTFTPEGTFLAAIDKLKALQELGITAIELMPVADFPGRWNWGYDGAFLYAPDSSYGRPEHLKALVDAAHGLGLCVFLDAVYNHFGPEGNYLQSYAPIVNPDRHTPWGGAINYDDAGAAQVREFIFANARHWLMEYHFDGLRLDAVQEIQDIGPRHMLVELAEQLRRVTDGRHIHLIVENSDNEAGWLKRGLDGEPWLYNAQWNDDLHHSLHNALTEENAWYYADFDKKLDLVGRSLAEGFGFQGEYLEHEKRFKGEPSAFLPATAFVAYAQNHDQIGNRPYGERITDIVSSEKARFWTAINLLSPQIPLLFMGEEWHAKQPFIFFSDVGAELADKVREGRRDEIKSFLPQPEKGHPPDPLSEDTFKTSKLDWSQREELSHSEALAHYRQLIALRRSEIIPRLYEMDGNSGRYELDGSILTVAWQLGDGMRLNLLANFSDQALSCGAVGGDVLWIEGHFNETVIGPWTAVFSLAQ